MIAGLGAVADEAGGGAILAQAPRPDTLATVAYDAIREAIVNRVLAPGQRVTEAGLARQLDVSKTPVREALLRLRQVGLIEDDGSRGGRVIQPSSRRLREAYQVREALEGLTAAMAAELATGEQRDAIAEAARESVKAAAAGDLERFRHFDHRFHMAIAAAAGNGQIERLLDDELALITTIIERDAPSVETSRDGGRSHTKTAEAIAAGDAERASALMREHMRYVQRFMLDGLAGEGMSTNAEGGTGPGRSSDA